MDSFVLSENMVEWLKCLYLNAKDKHKDNAAQYAFYASCIQKESVASAYKKLAKEHLEFAEILSYLVSEIESNTASFQCIDEFVHNFVMLENRK